jgi:hypothetical protein
MSYRVVRELWIPDSFYGCKVPDEISSSLEHNQGVAAVTPATVRKNLAVVVLTGLKWNGSGGWKVQATAQGPTPREGEPVGTMRCDTGTSREGSIATMLEWMTDSGLGVCAFAERPIDVASEPHVTQIIASVCRRGDLAQEQAHS